MVKKAWSFGSIGSTASDIVQTAADLVAMGGSYIIAAAVMGGMGIGYAGAKTTAHSKQDEATVQKGYENERLKSDIGYLSSKLNQEWSDSKKRRQPQSAGSIRLV